AFLSWPSSVGATSYTVKRATVSDGPYVSVGCPSATSFTDSNLQNGKTYYYVVAAQYSGGPDAGGASTDSVEASVTPQGGGGNRAPTVNGGSNQTITLPATASLIGTASDDGLPNPPGALTTTWSKVSGPGTVTFANSSALSTTASFSLAG